VDGDSACVGDAEELTRWEVLSLEKSRDGGCDGCCVVFCSERGGFVVTRLPSRSDTFDMPQRDIVRR
jgi:hypothetical protein